MCGEQTGGVCMKLEETSAPYSREMLARLMKVLEMQGVLPWLNPVTNAISIKSFNFTDRHCFNLNQELLVQKQTVV